MQPCLLLCCDYLPPVPKFVLQWHRAAQWPYRRYSFYATSSLWAIAYRIVKHDHFIGYYCFHRYDETGRQSQRSPCQDPFDRSWAPRAPPWSHLLSDNPVQETEYWLYWAFYTDGRRNKVIWSVPVVSRWRPMQSLWKMILYVIDHFIQSRIRSGGQVLILCVVHLWHKWETLCTSVSLRFVTPTVTPTVLYRQRVGTGINFVWSAVKTSIQTKCTTL